MIFKRKDSFFLDLTKVGSKPDTRAPESKPAVAPSQPAPQPEAVKPTAPATVAEQPEAAPAPEAVSGTQRVLTTAEAIAAELRAAQEARPAPSTATFAPECLNPAYAVPTPRRRAGANLGLFKGMVDEMFRS